MNGRPRNNGFWVGVDDTGDAFTRLSDIHGRDGVLVQRPLPSDRPTEKQWQRALCRLVARVDREGGLPKGWGRKEALIGWLAEEFNAAEQDSEPARRLIEDRVRWIYDAADEQPDV